MLSLFILVLFGIGVALFATQNTQTTSVFFGQYGFVDIPLYAVALGSMLFGIVVSWIVSLAGFVSTSMMLRGKEGRIRDAEARMHTLEERNRELELENSRLHGEEKVVEGHESLNPFVKFRQRFS